MEKPFMSSRNEARVAWILIYLFYFYFLDSLRIKERIMHFKWKFPFFFHFIFFFLLLFNISSQRKNISVWVRRWRKMYFITIIQFYPVFYFLYSSREKAGVTVEKGASERFGVEGFSIIIFCVIMIIFFRLPFFSKSFMFARKSSPWRLNLYKFCLLFLYQRVRSENVFIRIVCACMRVKWKRKKRRIESNPVERTFYLLSVVLLLCFPWGWLCLSVCLMLQ